MNDEIVIVDPATGEVTERLEVPRNAVSPEAMVSLPRGYQRFKDPFVVADDEPLCGEL